MKKLVLMLAAVAAISFASCGNGAANDSDSAKDSNAQVEQPADSAATVDSNAQAK